MLKTQAGRVGDMWVIEGVGTGAHAQEPAGEYTSEQLFPCLSLSFLRNRGMLSSALTPVL